MNYELYDILTIEEEKYIISSMVIENNMIYYLLLKIDENENVNSEIAKVYKQSAINNVEPDMLYPVVDEEELSMVSKSLYDAMQFDLDEEKKG